MELKNKVVYLYTETPLHVGIGTGLGAVDLPIQREKHTNYPMIQASGLKGALRDTAELKLGRGTDAGDTLIKRIFGGASGSDDETHAGAVSPSDARILCFPVRALNGVFVWVTSPSVLERYQRDTRMDSVLPDVRSLLAPSSVMVSDTNRCLSKQVVLEEFGYDAVIDDAGNVLTADAAKWAKHIADAVFGSDDPQWHARFVSHFVILPDDEFRDFVRYSTEIITRIHIEDETKIVKDGQLFTQELLPADSLLYSVVRVTSTREDKKDKMGADAVYTQLKNAVGTSIQIGADETVGRGRTRLSWKDMDA